MISVARDWNPRQALLKEIIYKKDRFNEAISIALELHSFVHSSEMSGVSMRTLGDEIWDGLSNEAFRIMPTSRDVTIAWNIWHITRIEDIVINILIDNNSQIINQDNWVKKMNAGVLDTGNSMSDDEIISFSNSVNMDELGNYRKSVGRRTREVLLKLNSCDMKRKMNKESLNRILDEGGVLDVEGSRWLVDFWGRKNVGGLILMPITRHQIVHITDSLRLKEKCLKKFKDKDSGK